MVHNELFSDTRFACLFVHNKKTEHFLSALIGSQCLLIQLRFVLFLNCAILLVVIFV